MPTTSLNSFLEENISKFMDPSKMMERFNMPGTNMNSLMDVQKKNLETIRIINQAAFANLQLFVQRQAEIMHSALVEAGGLANKMMVMPTAQEKIICQAEVSKNVIEKCMAIAVDASDTLAKCNNQAIEIASNRMKESLQELRNLSESNVAA